MKQILLSAFYIQEIKKNISLFVQAQKTGTENRESIYFWEKIFYFLFFLTMKENINSSTEIVQVHHKGGIKLWVWFISHWNKGSK